MPLFLLALLFLGFVIWRGRERPVLTRADWRTGAGLLAIGAFTAAAVLAVRGDWPVSAAMVAIACALLLGARSRRIIPVRPTARPGRPDRLSMAEARSILGVAEGATVEEIKAAYGRLMQRAHPDHGGSDGLAAQLNAARDRLMGRSR
ncbi:MAG TPA: DnaJ domain-containing protein [Caulobacteraceae bacterium]